MAVESILKSLHGRLIGLAEKDNSLIIEDRKHVAQVTITSAQVLALNATPIEVVPAPGAGFAIVPELIAVRHGTGTAYAGIAAGEDLAFKYTNGSGAEATARIETTGFLDQTTAELRVVRFPSAVAAVGQVEPVENAALVAHLLVGEITTGNMDLIVRVWYDIIQTAF